MMAVINVPSVFEYGRPGGLLKKLGCVGTKEVNGPQAAAAMQVMAKKAAAGVPRSTGGPHVHHPHAVDEEKMDVDEEMRSPTILSAEDALMELLAVFKFALQLMFTMPLTCAEEANKEAVVVCWIDTQPVSDGPPHLPRNCAQA